MLLISARGPYGIGVKLHHVFNGVDFFNQCLVLKMAQQDLLVKLGACEVGRLQAHHQTVGDLTMVMHGMHKCQATRSFAQL